MKGATVLRTLRRSATTGLMTLIVVACGSAAPIAPGQPAASGRLPSGLPGVPGVPGQPGGAAIDACTLLTDEEIRAVTDDQVLERRASTLTQVFPSVCDIELAAHSITVGVLSPGGKAMYETSFEPFIGQGEVGGYIEEAVPGLGDKAGRSGQSSLMVLSGDVLFDLQYLGARPDKQVVLRYLAERILAKLPCIANGCPPLPVPAAPTVGPPTPGPTQAVIDPGTLPSTGAQARLVNLYSEGGKPITVDVYAYAYSAAEMTEVGALVATVPYGTASEWFSPGLVEAPYSSDPYTKIDIFRHGETEQPLAGVSEFLGAPETVTTMTVWQDEGFDDQEAAWVQTIYAAHPTNPISTPAAGGGLLISRSHGLLAGTDDSPSVFASVGNGCLESPVGRSIPDIPNAQPIGNDLVLPVGDWTLTLHDAPFGEIPMCDTKPLGPGAEVSVAPGDRLLAFPYRLPGETEIELLVVPFEP